MTKPVDDLEAVRQVADTLQTFTETERERIIRWALERLGMTTVAPVGSGVPTSAGPTTPPGTPQASDIKSFVKAKDPKTDTHLAAVVAYYYRFVSPDDKKESITKDDFVDACRKAERRRPPRPAQTLVNAFASGLLDKSGHGSYKINSVGENLVAMVLPGKPESPNKKKSTKKSGKRHSPAVTPKPKRPRKTKSRK